mmetsp:Transcript_6129/g.12161  ORF Transcript_6129/g.12161 Transcript_6129/m.12161 type:complete len:496 (+) Transcript_6129:42-1529(+)
MSRDPDKTYRQLATIFSVKLRDIDLPAFRRCLLDSHKIVDKLNLNRPFSKTSSSFLHTAVWYRHVEITKWLLAWKADPNLQNLRGVTPMHFLAENIARKGNSVKECLRLLVKAGGNITKMKNKDGFTAMDIIKSKKMEGTAKSYLKGIKAIKGVQDSWRQQFVSYYENSDHDDNSAVNLDEIKDRQGNADSSETESSSGSTDTGSGIEEKSRARSKSMDRSQESKSQRAKRVFRELVQLLALQKGNVDESKFVKIIHDNKDIIKSGHLDLNQVTSKTGASLLHACVWYMKIDCIRALVEVGGADVMLKNQQGMTPLHLAAERGHKDDVKKGIDILMLAGASKTSKTKKGKTPPQKAKIPEIAEYILGWPHGSPYEKKNEEKKKPIAVKVVEEKAVVVHGERARWKSDWREMKILFDKMDWDKNGFLNFNDVRNSLVNMDLSFANRNVDAMMHHADPEGDGQISWEEFKIVIAKYTTIPRIKVEKGDPDWHDAKSD